MGKKKAPKVAAVAAAASQSAIDVKRAQNESADELRRRRGFQDATGGGEQLSVLG